MGKYNRYQKKTIRKTREDIINKLERYETRTVNVVEEKEKKNYYSLLVVFPFCPKKMSWV